jgi:2-(1,2-epoxy-1,2-dihydrophenyl)acetyl-CoA isomerase
MSPTTDPSVLLTITDGVATLTLNRPDKLNSFTKVLHLTLRQHLESIAINPAIRVVVLTGAGRGFCAGQDLADLQRDDGTLDDVGPLVVQWFNPLIHLIRRLPQPVIARVQGIAAGAGANLALACDFVVAAKSASFLQAFVNIGLVPDSGGTWFLPQSIGPVRARALTMLGEKLPAETAAQWGMIHSCVEDAALDDTCAALAKRLAALPPKSLTASKRAIDAALSQNLGASLDLEWKLQSELGASNDYKEGVNAFLQKRKPNFTGT